MEIINLNNCPQDDMLTYGGAAGTKFAVSIKGETWLLKFPESTKGFEGNHLPPYSTSPISEYVGSKVYESLDIPVHETMLGYRNGKIVVACKDFTAHGARLHEFKDIKNTLLDSHFEGAVGSSGRGEFLADALTTIENAPLLKRTDGVKERFWDMFVVDAFLRNNDRNNGNWGVLTTHGKATLAPVFDNGNSLFNKRTASAMDPRINNSTAISNDLSTGVSFFLDENGEQIHPFDYIATTENPDCNAALIRFLDYLDPKKISSIIDEIPNEAFGLEVISQEQKDFYTELLDSAYRDKLLPTGKTLGWNAAACICPPPQSTSKQLELTEDIETARNSAFLQNRTARSDCPKGSPRR